MRKIRTGKKIARAMALGLATMITLTSVPVTVNGDEQDPVTGEAGDTPILVDAIIEEIVDDAEGQAQAAEDYRGVVQEDDKTDPLTIGEQVQGALDDIEKIQNAQNGYADAVTGLKDTCDSVDAKFKEPVNDKTDPSFWNENRDNSGNGPGQISGKGQLDKAEDYADKYSDSFGVKFNTEIKTDESGNSTVNVTVTDQTAFDSKVTNANDKIAAVDTAKQAAYDALAGENGVQQAINNANGLITDAATAKDKADKATRDAMGDPEDSTNVYTQSEAVAKLEDIQKSVDKETSDALDAIQEKLEKAVTEEKLDESIDAAVGASKDAAKLAGDNLVKAQDALQQATDAANEAEEHSKDYTRQQMVDAATRAQQAATGAQQASVAADQAVEAANKKVDESKQAVKDAQDAVSAAEADAIEVLKAYRQKLSDINAKIDTANGLRSDAKTAMQNANAAIDAALDLMSKDTDSKQSANTKVLAIQTAIEQAESAISAVTGLTGSDDWKKANGWYGKDKVESMSPYSYVKGQLTKLEKAKKVYDDALEAAKEATAQKQEAAQAVQAIYDLIYGKDNKFAELADLVDADINDIKALLTTGKKYSQVEQEAKDAEDALPGQITKLENNEEGDTADQVVQKYNAAVGEQPGLEQAISGIEGEIEAQQGIIDECNSKDSDLLENIRKANNALEPVENAIMEKYVYDGSTGKILKDEKGEYPADKKDKDGYVYSESYLQLLADSKEMTEDTSAYKNASGQELEEKDADFKIGDDLYKLGLHDSGTITEGTKPFRLPNSCITEKNETKEIVGDKYVVTAACTYEQDIHNNYIVDDGGNGTNGFRIGYVKKTDYDEIKLDILKSYLCQNTKFHLGINYSDLNSSNMKVEDNTITITLPGDYENSSKVYTYKYTEWHGKTKGGNNGFNYQYSVDFSVNIKETTAVHTGSYTEVTKYDYEKYSLVFTPGGPTQKAQKALDKLNGKDGEKGINAKAEEAKNALPGVYQDKVDAWEAYNSNNAKRTAASNKINVGDPEKGVDSLNKQKADKEDKKTSNQNYINAHKDDVEAYNKSKEAIAAKKKADNFNPDTAEGLSGSDKKMYADAKDALQRVNSAQTKAKEYWNQADAALKALADSVEASEEAENRYKASKAKITDATNRLEAVRQKIVLLRQLQSNAVTENGFKDKKFDQKIKLKDGTEVDLLDLQNELNSALNALSKFADLEEYNQLNGLSYNEKFGFVIADEIADAEGKPGDVTAKLSEKLTNAIKLAAEILEKEKVKLDSAIAQKEKAESDAKTIQDRAKKAQEEADRAAKALANWVAPSPAPAAVPATSSSSSDDDDDDDDSSSEETGSGAGSAGTYATIGATVASAGTIPVIPLPATAAGVAGVRTTRATASRGVAGVRVDNGDGEGVGDADANAVSQSADNNSIPVVDNTGKKNNTVGADKKLVKLENNEVPLADKPFEEGADMSLLWLLAAAAAAGAGAYGYGKHRKKVAAADEVKKYKKN